MLSAVWSQMLASVGASDEGDIDVGGVLPTGTVTLLLADVEGSTRLWEQQPEAMTVAIALLNRTVAELIATHDGVRPVEQGEGDSFVAAFTRASDAVACALALQRADLAPIKLRIGIHAGEVQLRDEGNYAGPTINKTARLRDLAHGGQTVMSGVTGEVVEDRLPVGTWLTELGDHRLRDVSRPLRVVQLCHPDLDNDFPPLCAANTAAKQRLPAQLTSFVGRGAQLTEIGELLAENRLVTLTGAGGAGKTRLAIEVASQLSIRFPEGIWFADLAPITHPDVVPLTVARAMGLPDQPGRSITDTLLGFVRDRRIFLVLDNCEHLLAASAGLVDELLAACPKVTVLATSREPLIVGGEVIWQVPSLALTDEAIELFTDRARRARPNFTVTEGNAETVTEICRRLDGMPLAIELAAARVRSLSLDEIVGSLHDRFRLLTGGARTAVRRQQTLRASVDWSHALLTEPERVLFRRLSVFMGGFDFGAAQAVAGATEVERFQVLDQLSLLVDKSLVAAENASGSTRYRLLETVRQYALERLGESGEADDIRARHRDHYAAMARRLDAPARSSKEHLVAQAEVEIDNLRAAFVWCRENKDVTGTLELASSLQPLWVVRGRVAEGAAWFDAALDGQFGDWCDAAAPIRARALADRAMLGLWAELTDAIKHAEEAIVIAREVADPVLLSRVLTACGSVHADDYESARPYFVEATALARALGDNWWLCQIFSRQTNGAFASGDFTDAEAVAREGMELADALGDDFGSDQCRVGLVSVHAFRGEVAAAIVMVRELIERATRANDLMSKVIGLFEQTFVLAFCGDAVGARTSAGATVEAGSECPGLLERAIHSAVTAACLADGDPEAAWDAALAAERVGIVIRGVDDLHMVWTAQAALAHGDLDVASRRADVAVAASNGCWLATALSTRACIRLARRENDQAANDACEALMAASATGAHLATADTLECLATLACDAGSHSEATRLLGAANAHRQRLGLVRFKVFDGGHHALVSTLRNTMGNGDFDIAWAAGAALSTEEAIAYAQRGRGERKRPSSGWGALTPTELDVVRLVGEGLPNKDIATRLFVSPRTVQSHLRHVYGKLEVTSRVQLAQEAARHG
jgi:predicted ATPase/class 3 adenylate cyclase/DNA-binding CsgD family transcriptional regulator